MRLAYLPGVVALIGCSTSSSPATTVGAAGVGSPCASYDDCPPPTLCAFALDAGCAAQGRCVHEDLSCTVDGPVVCACDGTPVGLACIYGQGNAAVPVPMPSGPCPSDGATE